MPSPTLGRFTSAATKALRSTPSAPLAGAVPVTDGREAVACTEIVWVAVAVAPEASVTVSETVYVPAVA